NRSPLPPKNLIGVPWRVAFALQATGAWFLRNAIIWAKTNPMPESVRDRLSTTYELLFLLTRADTYYFNLDPIRLPLKHPQAPQPLPRRPRRTVPDRPTPAGDRRRLPTRRNRARPVLRRRHHRPGGPATRPLLHRDRHQRRVPRRSPDPARPAPTRTQPGRRRV